VEFGSGAAGPIVSRYFKEHGATVIKVESRRHPDFLRVMAANSSHGLDYAQLAGDKPDLLMLSTCLNGQDGPHKDDPGFGGEGAALSGLNFLTDWPDREPVGPYGTITDSLAPRFAASALATGLLYRRRTGNGLHIDIAQVETGVYSLSPWLLGYGSHGQCSSRCGNRSGRAAPHGVCPCAGDDRWIAIACWNDHEWLHLATILGMDWQRYPTLAARQAAEDEVEDVISSVTRNREAERLAKQLQYAGIEAVPVTDFEQLLRDPQLQQRDHFVRLQRQRTGESIYERNGFRLSYSASSIECPSPLLGEHTNSILESVLGYSTAQVCALHDSGALE